MNASHPQPALREGLIAIPRNEQDLASAVHDLHTLGLSPRTISVVGRRDATAAENDQAAEQLAAQIATGDGHEAFGASLGAALGLLGGLAALSLPGLGALVVAGGAAFVLLETMAAATFGGSIGIALASLLDLVAIGDHDALFKRELAAGHWILLITGEPAELRRAEVALSVYDLIHLDRI